MGTIWITYRIGASIEIKKGVVYLPDPSLWWSNHVTKPAISIDAAIITLEADPDSVNFLRAKFSNLPITSTGRCIWNGQIAQFIWDNL